MIDPLVSLMMPDRDDRNEHNPITVEEAMDCREATRFFSLLNQNSCLKVIISKSSTIISCRLGGHEIIVDCKYYNQKHEAWAIGDRPYQKLPSLTWNCHVRGPELVLSASNGASSLVYELNSLNELNCIAKLKTPQLQHQVIYFNLNNPIEKTFINGHTIAVRCNGNINRIKAVRTKLLCYCNKSASILPHSLIGDIPYELAQHPASNSFISNDQISSQDDLIVCDAIYSLESNCPLDFLQVQLQYCSRALIYEVRSAHPIVSNNQANNVSSSTQAIKSSSSARCRDAIHDLKPASGVLPSSSTGSIDSIVVGNSGSEAPRLNQFYNNCEILSSSNDVKPSDLQLISSNNDSNRRQDNSVSALATSHQSSTILKIRVRITNFGVCLMPYMMTNYISKYKFAW